MSKDNLLTETENLKGLYKLLLALRLFEAGERLIPLTKKGNLLEDFRLDHDPSKGEYMSWFGFLDYDIGIIHKDTITHVEIIYSKKNGENKRIITEKLITDMTAYTGGF